MQGRTNKSLVNIVTALIGQSIAIVVGFITRVVFVKQLGDVYLGVNGLCTSIIGLLSLAELGIGDSINYKLYKPLYKNDIDQIKSLMRLYQRVYQVIGIVTFAIGLLLLPFLNFFVNQSDIESCEQLHLIFLLFVTNSALSYFYSYKRALIISDQKRYIVTIIHYSFYCFMNIAQILVLIKTKNFILYLIIMLICTVTQNVLISNKADKLYPFIKEKNVQSLKPDDISEIKKNTVALLYHKVGSQVVNSTDNILASKIIGIAIVGIYSNYLMVTTALNTIVAQLFSAITASVGNLGVSEEKEKSESVMKRLFFGNFWFIAIVCSSFYSSIELLLDAMFGKAHILGHGVLICIVINLYLYNIRRTAWTFRDGYGLFWYDRYKAIAEAAINLIISIILGLKFGLIGILVGTIVSTVSTSLWVEPYILYKYAFKRSPRSYFFYLFVYTTITSIICIICRYLVMACNFSGILGFVGGCLMSFLISSLFITAIFWKTDEYMFYISLLSRIVNKYVFHKTS